MTASDHHRSRNAGIGVHKESYGALCPGLRAELCGQISESQALARSFSEFGLALRRTEEQGLIGVCDPDQADLGMCTVRRRLVYVSTTAPS